MATIHYGPIEPSDVGTHHCRPSPEFYQANARLLVAGLDHDAVKLLARNAEMAGFKDFGPALAVVAEEMRTESLYEAHGLPQL